MKKFLLTMLVAVLILLAMIMVFSDKAQESFKDGWDVGKKGCSIVLIERDK